MRSESQAKAGDFSYGLRQSAFAPLPKGDPRRRRADDVRRYRTTTKAEERPRWNPSTIDEAHPFPERACTNTLSHYDGVEVVDTYFPAAVKGTVALRVSADPFKKSTVWATNESRAHASNRYCFRPSSGTWSQQGQNTQPSYLASTIMQENTEEKKRQRQGWCGSSALDGNFANRHVAPAADPVDYVAVNKTKADLMTSVHSSYVTPRQRVTQMYNKQRKEKTLRQAAAQATPYSLYDRADAPKVFTMSNMDSWWDLDPVQVSAEQMAKKEAMRENPYSAI